MRPFIHLSFALVILILVTGSRLSAAPNTALRVEIAALTAQLVEVIKKNGGGNVAIGEFAADPSLDGSAAPAVQLIFTEEFTKAKVRVDPHDFQHKVTGEYKLVEVKIDDGGNGKKINVVKLEVKLKNKAGASLLKTPTGSFIFGPETVPVLVGASVSGQPTDDPAEISERIGEAVKKPQAEIKDKKIVSSTGEFAIEVLVKQSGGYSPAPVTLDKAKQKHFTSLKVDDVYGVRIHNFTDVEAAVDLRIDGVSFLHFASTTSEYHIIPANSYADILGWQVAPRVSKEFVVVSEFANTAAAKLNLSPAATGMISVTFAAAWMPGTPTPANQRGVVGAARRAVGGTGIGNNIVNDTKQETRIVGAPQAVITVRYDR